MQSDQKRIEYDGVLKRVAKRLGVPLRGNLEKNIISYCKNQIYTWISVYGQPKDLTDLLNLVCTSLGLCVEEIHDNSELEALMERIPPQREPIMAVILSEFNEHVDAVTIRRDHREPWEQPFLAVINCQGYHEFRRYFSKWHEAAHRLVDGDQLKLALRTSRTSDLKKEPEEILVDKVAAALAFFSDIFEPVFHSELANNNALTFEIVDKTRQRVAAEASRHATTLACVGYCPQATWFIRCGLGLKKGEKRQLLQGELIPDDPPVPKLRVHDVACSPAAFKSNIRIHRNMQVPESSLVAQLFNEPLASERTGIERLEIWKTSNGGPVGQGTIFIQTVRIGDDEAWAILTLQN